MERLIELNMLVEMLSCNEANIDKRIKICDEQITIREEQVEKLKLAKKILEEKRGENVQP